MACGLPGGRRFWLLLLLVAVLTLHACEGWRGRRNRQFRKVKQLIKSLHSSSGSSSGSSSESSESSASDCSATSSSSRPPLVADAGEDVVGEISSDSLSFSTQLSGTGSPECDDAFDFQWRMLEGPAGPNFSACTDRTTSVTVTVAGTYTFQLCVSDDCGREDCDNVTVTVNAATLPPPPVANAGEDMTRGLNDEQPRSFSTQLNGTGSPPCQSEDDDALNFEWTVIEGPAEAEFSNSADKMSNVTMTVLGIYVLQLRVSDAFGQQDVDNVTVRLVPVCSWDAYAWTGTKVNGTSGSFVSHGGYGSVNYTENYECSVYITVPEGWAVKLNMVHVDFDIEDENLCAYTRITVQDGFNSYNPTIFKYCRDQPFDPPTSSTNKLAFHFDSFGIAPDAGFEFSWVADGCAEGACKNGATCVSNPYPTPPTCTCAPGYVGDKWMDSSCEANNG